MVCWRYLSIDFLGMKKQNIIIVAVLILVIGGLVGGWFYAKSTKLDRLIKLPAGKELNDSQKQTLEDVRSKLSADIAYYSGLLNLAKLKAELGDKSSAENLYLELLKRKSEDVLVLGNLGTIYYDAGQYEKAEEMQLKIIAVTPKWINSYRELMDIYQFHLKDKRASLEPLLMNAIEKSPEFEADLTSLTAVYYDQVMNNREKAIEYYEKALKVSPTNDTIASRLKELKNQK